jgi:hypothetical protein
MELSLNKKYTNVMGFFSSQSFYFAAKDTIITPKSIRRAPSNLFPNSLS